MMEEEEKIPDKKGLFPTLSFFVTIIYKFLCVDTRVYKMNRTNVDVSLEHKKLRVVLQECEVTSFQQF